MIGWEVNSERSKSAGMSSGGSGRATRSCQSVHLRWVHEGSSPLGLGGMYSISCSSNGVSCKTLSLAGSVLAGLGAARRADVLALGGLVFAGSLSSGAGPGVWKGFALALVVFWPSGARVRGAPAIAILAPKHIAMGLIFSYPLV